MWVGRRALLGRLDSLMTPVGRIEATFRVACSVNQTLPSGPSVMPVGWLSGVGTGYSVTRWVAGSRRPMRLAAASVNQRAPSAPGVISVAGLGNGVLGVMAVVGGGPIRGGGGLVDQRGPAAGGGAPAGGPGGGGERRELAPAGSPARAPEGTGKRWNLPPARRPTVAPSVNQGLPSGPLARAAGSP